MRIGMLVALLLNLSYNSYSQATTETEYKYMKSGYRQVAESGVDLKKGYTVQEGKKATFGEIALTPILLKRNNGSLAGTILKISSTEKSDAESSYYAIPALDRSSSEVSYGWSDYLSDVGAMTCKVKEAVLKWMSAALSSELSRAKK